MLTTEKAPSTLQLQVRTLAQVRKESARAVELKPALAPQSPQLLPQPLRRPPLPVAFALRFACPSSALAAVADSD